MCRCFGHDEDLETATANSNSSQGIHESSSQISAKKRASRLELKDKQWDELFEKTSKSPSRQSPTKRSISNSNTGSSSNNSSSQANKQRKKKPVEARDEIFRMKAKEDASNSASQGFARLWNPYMALCFATPVRGASEEVAVEETDLASETATLNTNEDTITSTVYFENKYSHITETRPPMPLFNQFKIGNEKDEIRNIMNSDSHSSVNMIRLLAQNNSNSSSNSNSNNQKGDDEVPDVTSTDSSSRESSKMRPNGVRWFFAVDSEQHKGRDCARHRWREREKEK